ncbi:MAG: PEGA domain-containing protein [Deltaproteobacteria bacterium]|nr:PEGA domain-containing protein [Deltaproteobacteria bacterium]
MFANRAPALVALAIGVGGCATIFSDSTQTLTFTSEPPGAEVMIDGQSIGRTPATITVNKKAFGHPVVTVTLPGYQVRQFVMQKDLNNIALSNSTSLLSWLTDAGTGAVIEYSPSSYYVELMPSGGNRSPGISRLQRRARFVLLAYPHLLRELAGGPGEYTRALETVYEIPEDRRPEFRARLRRAAPSLLETTEAHDFQGKIDALAAADES